MHYIVIQPPSGGCVLKQDRQSQSNQRLFQPPSGGCVLKHGEEDFDALLILPAAFRRLCVETRYAPKRAGTWQGQPPSGGCVLKHRKNSSGSNRRRQPPSGGCVLKL